jgi:hypothetical protein
MNTQFRKDLLPERCAIHSRNRFREIRGNQPNPPSGETFSIISLKHIHKPEIVDQEFEERTKRILSFKFKTDLWAGLG